MSEPKERVADGEQRKRVDTATAITNEKTPPAATDGASIHSTNTKNQQGVD